jgi:hypothetical protein
MLLALDREQLPQVVGADHLERVELAQALHHRVQAGLGLGGSGVDALEIEDREPRLLLIGLRAGEAGEDQARQDSPSHGQHPLLFRLKLRPSCPASL